MKLTVRLALSCVLISSLLLSCKKNHDVTPPPPVITGTITINLSYPSPSSAVKTYELIVSETGGKILLDSTVAFDVPVKATLHTNEKLVDLSTVYYISDIDQYFAHTYKAVDPSGWASATVDRYATADTAIGIPATILYTHVPNFDDHFPTTHLFYDDKTGIGNTGSSYSQFYQTLNVSYARYAGNYDYLLIPTLGLYNFHFPVSNADTVDLSHMDTAVNVIFNKPSQYTLDQATLTGIMDTTDVSKSIDLFDFPFGVPGVQLLYPKKYVQKYELTVYAHNANNGHATFYNYGNAVPTNLPYADESYYNLTSNQNNNLAVSFAPAPVKPSYQETYWIGGKIFWFLYASPDSTTFHPLNLLTSLKSQLLQGQNLSSLQLSSLTFSNEQGYDYATWLLHACNPAPLTAIRSKTYSLFTKYF